jgi:hypothetical protein
MTSIAEDHGYIAYLYGLFDAMGDSGHNGRDALKDAYEEALDLVMYLRQAMAEER